MYSTIWHLKVCKFINWWKFNILICWKNVSGAIISSLVCLGWLGQSVLFLSLLWWKLLMGFERIFLKTVDHTEKVRKEVEASYLKMFCPSILLHHYNFQKLLKKWHDRASLWVKYLIAGDDSTAFDNDLLLLDVSMKISVDASRLNKF